MTVDPQVFQTYTGYPLLPPLPTLTPEQVKEYDQVITNMVSLRREIISRVTDPRRNIYHECGYPEVDVDTATYYDKFLRDPLAARVVEVFARESWQAQPTVYESEDMEVETAFEQKWKSLGRGLRAEESFYQDEVGSQIWEVLSRADILSGVGYFGGMLLGLDDITTASSDNALATPATPSPDRKLLYMRPFPQPFIQILETEKNFGSPRYGMPTEYGIQFNGDVNADYKTVHWSRVIHLADVGHQAQPSETQASPRMRPVFHPILNCEKLYGGSAEMYWRGAFPGLSIQGLPQTGGRVTMQEAAVKSAIENYMNGLQRYIALVGMEAKSLAPQVVDPSPQINVQIEAICIKLGVPKRVFMGSERGELASSQDDAAWNDRLRDRQRYYITPRIIVPFVDRLIGLGVLPTPVGYSVSWPDLTSQSELEKADVAIKRTSALAQYVTGGVYKHMGFVDYLVKFHGMAEKEAMAVAEKGKKEYLILLEEEMARQEEKARRQAELQAELQEEFGSDENGVSQDGAGGRNVRKAPGGDVTYSTQGVSRSKPGAPATRKPSSPVA